MTEQERKDCPICLRPNCLAEPQLYQDTQVTEFSCDVCGKYQIHWAAESIFKSKSSLDKQRIILSSIIRNRYEKGERTYINEENKQDILNSMYIPSNPFEAIDLLLEYIAYKTDNRPGKDININLQTDYPILFAEDHEEFEYYVHKASALQFIESRRGTKSFMLTLNRRFRQSRIRTFHFS